MSHSQFEQKWFVKLLSSAATIILKNRFDLFDVMELFKDFNVHI